MARARALHLLPEGVGPSFDRFVFSRIQTPAGEVLTNLSYLVALSLIEPLYVASGFTLYLNRRTESRGLGHRDRLPPTRRAPRQRPRGRLMRTPAASYAAIRAPRGTTVRTTAAGPLPACS